MAEINLFPSDYPSEIIGYVEPWIASPGDRVDVKVGSPNNCGVYYQCPCVYLLLIDVALSSFFLHA